MSNKSKLAKLIRKNINLPVKLVTEIETYSKNNGLDFTSSVIVLLNSSIDRYKKRKKAIYDRNISMY